MIIPIFINSNNRVPLGCGEPLTKKEKIGIFIWFVFMFALPFNIKFFTRFKRRDLYMRKEYNFKSYDVICFDDFTSRTTGCYKEDKKIYKTINKYIKK